MGLKVSVVVPVYNPGAHIDGLITSLRRQSLPAEEFEVVFVDDGSTDGTGERLDRLAAEAPNMRVIHTPNSGWPGRPRNIGIEASRGEYVQFVDNDDELGDKALERLYDYAVENNSDVVVGKEIRRPGPPVFGPLFRVNRPRASLETDPLLSILTPHKLFRRSFLEKEGIRFFEGPRRLEDHPFVVKAYFRAKVISVLSDYTCYYWVQRSDRSNAGLRTPDWAEWYGFLRDALDVVEEHTVPGEFRDRLLSHWYRAKGLARLGAGFPRRSAADAARLLDALHDLAAERFPPSVDAHLPALMRVRSALLRAREFDRICALADVERGMQLQQTVEPLEVTDGALVFKATASLAYADGQPVVLDAVGERLYWRAPIDLGPHVSRETLDFTDGYPRTRLNVVARARSSYEAVLLPGGSEPPPPLADGARAIGAAGVARLDPGILVNGQPLPVGVWDIQVQLASCGWAPRQPLRSPPGAVVRAPLGPALSQPRLVLPFTTVRGTVALDVGQCSLPLLRFAPQVESEASLQPTADGVRLQVPLTGFTIEGECSVGQLRLLPEGGGQPATTPLLLVGEGASGLPRLVAEVTLAGRGAVEGLGRGRWRLSVETRGRKTELGLLLVVDGGGASLRRASGRTAPVAALRNRLRRLHGARTVVPAARRVSFRVTQALRRSHSS